MFTKALHLWAALAERLGSLGLELHPDKTKVVYCTSTPASISSATPSGDAWPKADEGSS